MLSFPWLPKSVPCQDRPCSTYPVISAWTFGLLSTFWLLCIMLWCTFVFAFLCRHVSFLSLCTHFYVDTFHFSIHIPRSRVAKYLVTLCLTFWGAARLFPTAAAPFNIATSFAWEFQFLHVLSSTCHYLSWLQPSCRCEVVTHYSFDMFP